MELKLIMHSGGARGSDTLWGDFFLNKINFLAGNKEVNHYYHKKATLHGNKEISEEDFNEGLHFAKLAAKSLNRYWSNKPYIHYLLARNWVQVRESQIIFAIGELDEEKQQVSGGTGYAIEMGKYLKKPIYLINLNNLKGKTFEDRTDIATATLSYDYNINHFVIDKTVKNKINLSETGICYNNFAGIGTRNLKNIDMDFISFLNLNVTL